MAKYSHPPIGYLIRLIRFVPWFVLTKVGLISAQAGKEQFLKLFYKGMTLDEFDQCCESFCQKYLPDYIYPTALRKIHDYKDKGVSIFIVSASPQNWIVPWAKPLGIQVIATRLDTKGGMITGKIKGANCNRAEKVNRIKEAINLSDFSEVIAFGDSQGDHEMLKIADKKYYKFFK